MREEEGRTLFLRLYWQGDALIFATRITEPRGDAANVLTYWLRGNGRILEAEERFRSPWLSYENVWVFDKR